MPLLSNLTIRVLVAVVAIPLILLLVLAGGFLFSAFVAALSTLALRELYLLSRAKGAMPQMATGLGFGLLLNAVFVFDRIRFSVAGLLDRFGQSVATPSMPQFLLIVMLSLVPVTLAIELFRGKPGPLINTATTVFGAVSVALMFGSLIGIRELFVPGDFPVYAHFSVPGPSVPEDVIVTIDRWGAYTVIAVFASIWLCDSAAYFTGRAVGRHKLFERVSPNKTWEGALAGFAAAVVAFLVARWLLLPYLTFTQALVCGVIVGVFGQIGDLAESLLKRDAGVKDSSSLIPGHGGLLDRFDSLLFVSPLFYCYLDFIVF